MFFVWMSEYVACHHDIAQAVLYQVTVRYNEEGPLGSF